METLTSRELVPFAAAVAAGVDAVLTAHIVVEACDDVPASLSERWTEHLRRTTGFDGAIITDALDMEAVAEGHGIRGIADAAVRALGAGSDLLCLGSNFDGPMTDTVIDAIAEAVSDGRLQRAELVRSHGRIAALRRPRVVDVSEHAHPTVDAASIVAARALRLTGTLPPGQLAILECRPRLSMAGFNVRWGVAEHLHHRGWPTATISETDAIAHTCDDLLGRSGERAVLVVVRDAGVHAWQQCVVEHCRQRRPGMVFVVELGWPDECAGSTDEIPIAIATYGASRASTRALVELLVSKES